MFCRRETAVSIRRDGKRVWRGNCAFDPASLPTLIGNHAAGSERAVFATGAVVYRIMVTPDVMTVDGAPVEPAIGFNPGDRLLHAQSSGKLLTVWAAPM
jgi:hypothetical protein